MPRLPSDKPFFAGMGLMMGLYLGLILAVVVANGMVVRLEDLGAIFQNPGIRASIKLTFLSCTLTAILAVFFSVPIGYLLSRFRFPGRVFIDGLLDIPIILPPLVVGLSLLLLFNKVPFPEGSLERWLNARGMAVTFAVPAVVLAQFSVATAFAVRMMKNTFDQIDPRCEKVALTLGCHQSRAFWWIVLPQAGQGIVGAGALAWARALGEFGPILVFAGATRGRTEVLATSVFLEINIGNLGGAATISLLMILLAVTLIFIIRQATSGESGGRIR